MKKLGENVTALRAGAGRPLIASRRKTEAVVRMIGGETADDVARSLGVTVPEVEAWRQEFITAGERCMAELPLGWLERCLSPFERLVPLATLVSIAIGVVLFVQGQRRERAARERDNARNGELRVTESLTALDDKYIGYIKM